MILTKHTHVNIVVNENSCITTRFAAEELSKYLFHIVGAPISFSQSRISEGCNICVGGPFENKAALFFMNKDTFSQKVFGPEGMYIQIKGDNALIAGSFDEDGCNRGNLYAVYEFLERYLGCCFGAYSGAGIHAGEYVPSLETVVLDDVTYIKAKADLPYRTAIPQYNCWVGDADHGLNVAFFDWLVKNRYNRILTWTGIYEQYVELGLIGELEKRGIRLSVGHHHAAMTWLPPFGNQYIPIKYAEEHPEYYRLQEDGTRYAPKSLKDFTGQLTFCNRNETLIEEISQNIINWLQKNPIVDTIAFWPNDDMAPSCCCEACQGYTKTENYLYFENELAKRVAKRLPHVKIDVLIYNDLWECPESAELCDNVIIDQSTWAYTGLRKCGKPDGSGIIGTLFEKNILDYRKKCKNVVFYEYYMGNYGNRQRIMPSADELQSLYKHFMEVGISGSGTQIECFNVWNNLLNFYCFARSAYDTELSLSEQIRRISRLFGEGADEMTVILKEYEDALDGQVPISETGAYFMRHINKARMDSLFEAALDSAKDKRFRNNIRLMRMAFRYSELITDTEKETKDGAISSGDELSYMHKHFNSFLSKGGYGIAIAWTPKEAIDFVPDRWYIFD